MCKYIIVQIKYFPILGANRIGGVRSSFQNFYQKNSFFSVCWTGPHTPKTQRPLLGGGPTPCSTPLTRSIFRIMKFYTQVVGGATGDSTPSIVFCFENKRYLFNCGEGTQRFCTEHKVKMTKIDTIFVTRLSWDLLGGIPGTSFVPTLYFLIQCILLYLTVFSNVTLMTFLHK
jgi:hypothetical protein